MPLDDLAVSLCLVRPRAPAPGGPGPVPAGELGQLLPDGFCANTHAVSAAIHPLIFSSSSVHLLNVSSCLRSHFLKIRCLGPPRISVSDSSFDAVIIN